jgi:hypothetical protein
VSRFVLLVPLAVTVLTACQASTGDAASGEPAAVPPGASADAPQEFASRASLPSCGVYSLGQGEEPPSSARSCLSAALADQKAAELMVTSLTVEGQPVVTYYRSGLDPRLEVFIDSTRDQYGSGWVRLECQGLAKTRLEPVGCGDAERL